MHEEMRISEMVSLARRSRASYSRILETACCHTRRQRNFQLIFHSLVKSQANEIFHHQQTSQSESLLEDTRSICKFQRIFIIKKIPREKKINDLQGEKFKNVTDRELKKITSLTEREREGEGILWDTPSQLISADKRKKNYLKCTRLANLNHFPGDEGEKNPIHWCL